jgi:hypothetical protein
MVTSSSIEVSCQVIIPGFPPLLIDSQSERLAEALVVRTRVHIAWLPPLRSVIAVATFYAQCGQDKKRKKRHLVEPPVEQKESPCDIADSIHSAWSA